MKTLAGCWSYQVLKLQAYLGAFLRQAAVFKGVAKLIGLSDSHQES